MDVFKRSPNLSFKTHCDRRNDNGLSAVAPPHRKEGINRTASEAKNVHRDGVEPERQPLKTLFFNSVVVTNYFFQPDKTWC